MGKRHKDPPDPAKDATDRTRRPPDPVAPRSPPGKVRRVSEPRPTGMAGLRARLQLSKDALLNEVADAALKEIAELEQALTETKPTRPLEIQSHAISLQL